MLETDPQGSRAVGLDLGTSRIVSAQCQDTDILFGTQLNAFTTIPFSKLTEGVLKKERIPYVVQDSLITVYGDESERFANLFHTETRRPMRRGILNPDELANTAIVREIVTLLTGEKKGRGQKLCFSVPAAPVGASEQVVSHQHQMTRMLGDLGYEVRSIPEGLAVVYGEMESSNYTGIGISCGGGLCNVCFAYLSVPVLSFSIPKAGDFIDAQSALVTGDLATRLRVQKELGFRLNGMNGSRVNNALTVYYDQVIENLVKSLKESISSAPRLPKLTQAIPLVLAGGTVIPEGFFERFRDALQANELPVKLSEVRVSAEPLNAIARGLLMAALC